MPPHKPVAIAGGGLAGLTLGILLRRRKVPVKVFEAGSYPHHRVCGEFISGRGRQIVENIGLPLEEHGAIDARTVALFAPGMAAVQRPLLFPALCISRFILDDLLAQEFRKLGGDLSERERFQEGKDIPDEGVVHANGRRLQPVVGGWRWFGLKAHARGVETKADLEVHVVRGGYVGLCRLKDELNICGLFRSETTVPGLAQKWRETLQGDPGSELEKRLASAEFDEQSFCSVAGLYVAPRRIESRDRCEIGDALTMIPPVTGNGMSMAFEAADLAAEPLFEYSCGGISWDAARGRIAVDCQRQFARRLRCSSLLHAAMFHRRAFAGLRLVLPRFPLLVDLLFKWTR